jgi:hypothetical protein
MEGDFTNGQLPMLLSAVAMLRQLKLDSALFDFDPVSRAMFQHEFGESANSGVR